MIYCAMTESEVMVLASRIGKTISYADASSVLAQVEARLEECRRTGRPRIFDETVYKVLRNEA